MISLEKLEIPHAALKLINSLAMHVYCSSYISYMYEWGLIENRLCYDDRLIITCW